MDHTPGFLPNVLTSINASDLSRALLTAWRDLWEETPKRETILVLLAHSALETGRWRACHCWNLGNIKSRVGDGRDWTFYRCNEVIGGKTVWFDPPDPTCRFRAFRTLTEGAVDHLAFLRGMKRYALAWPLAVAGDPYGFVRELRAGGYFTAPLDPYEHAVASIFRQYANDLPAFDDEPPPDRTALDESERDRILQRVALSLSELATAELEHVRSDTEPAPPPDDAA